MKRRTRQDLRLRGQASIELIFLALPLLLLCAVAIDGMRLYTTYYSLSAASSDLARLYAAQYANGLEDEANDGNVKEMLIAYAQDMGLSSDIEIDASSFEISDAAALSNGYTITLFDGNTTTADVSPTVKSYTVTVSAPVLVIFAPLWSAVGLEQSGTITVAASSVAYATVERGATS